MTEWIFGVGLVSAAAFDVAQRRVPNLLTVPLLVAGLIMSALAGRVWLEIGLGVVVAFCVIVPFFHFRVYRGGDAKLLIACGAWLPTLDWLFGFAIGMALGAVHATVVLIRDREERMKASQSLTLLVLSRLGTLGEERDRERPAVPMALSFGAGMLCVICVDLAPLLGVVD